MRDNILSLISNNLSVVDLIRLRTNEHPAKRAFTFLENGEVEGGYLTYKDLDLRAKAVAAILQKQELQGQRALLFYQSGLEYIIALIGCLYAGVIAVPVYPPRMNHNLLRLQHIIEDCQPKVILSTELIMSKVQSSMKEFLTVPVVRWLLTDTISPSAAREWSENTIKGDNLAIIQYTSGSVGNPKGVMVSHENIIHNTKLIKEAANLHEDVSIVGWLPLFHDMGLICNIFATLYSGSSLIFMSYLHFLQKPYRWLKAVSDYKAYLSGGPNFAYDLCVNMISAEQKESLDLSSWKVAYNGSEPVRAQTINNFVKTFKPFGFSMNALCPSYGMAEATLFVSGGSLDTPPIIKQFNNQELEKNRVVVEKIENTNNRSLIGCGQARAGHEIAIVNPDNLKRCLSNEIGEIWIKGSSIAKGYWNKVETTESAFRAYISESEDGPYLRTGDLGFIEAGNLFVTGRIKDLIIIRGTNHYPQDIEQTVENCNKAIRSGCSAAFSLDVDGEEKLIIVAEIERQYRCRKDLRISEEQSNKQRIELEAIYHSIKESVAKNHNLQVYKSLLLRPGSIRKTSSGKIQRHACKKSYLNGTLIVEEVK